jgi:hypothetical protein
VEIQNQRHLTIIALHNSALPGFFMRSNLKKVAFSFVTFLLATQKKSKRRKMRQLTHILAIILLSITTQAQDFSYVYIQGDKQTPFYVKLEDEMMPRYGKNYSIISQLAPGPVNLEILFQQNVYPPQKFAINVPEHGYRGFLLLKKNNGFSLYDIQQQFYVQAGNKLEDDRAPVGKGEVAFVPVETKAEAVANTIKEQPKPASKKSKKVKAEVAAPSGPQFMSNVELDNPHLAQQQDPKVIKNEVAIINSDCPSAIDNDAFERIFNKVSDKDDRNRLKYLLEQMNNCYTTNQARILTKTLKTDAERFTYLKNIYPRITDQSTFRTLENLLTTEEWKNYFRSMLMK